MSYYANGGGHIEFKRKNDAVVDLLDYFSCAAPEETGCTYDIWDDGKYYGDDLFSLLTETNDVTVWGSLRYFGENENVWELYYDEKNKEWIEENATILWPSEKGDNMDVRK